MRRRRTAPPGRRHVPRAGRWRRQLATSLALAVLALGLPLAVAPDAAAQPVTADVAITSITPAISGTTTSVHATGTITNTGGRPLAAVIAAFWIDDRPIGSPADLAQAAAERPGTRLGLRIVAPDSALDHVAPTLAPKQRARFSLDIPVKLLRLPGPGVYQVGVDVQGTPTDEARLTVGRARTFLPYIPSVTDVGQTQLIFLVPLTAPPELVGGDTVLSVAAGDVFAATGRLTRLLTDDARPDVTFLLDPAILDEAAVMSKPYRTADGTRHNASPAAQQFLALARRVLPGQSVALLPYGNPDVVSLVHQGLAAAVSAAAQASIDAARRFGIGNAPILAWPAGGAVDAATLEVLVSAGLSTVLLSTASVPALRGNFPLASLDTPAGPATAVVADPALLAGSVSKTSAVTSRQRLLAGTALDSLAHPGGTAPDVAVPLPSLDFDPTGLLAAVDQQDWLATTSIDGLLNAQPVLYDGDLHYPAAAKKSELSEPVVAGLTLLSGDGRTYADLFTDPAPVRTDLLRQFLCAASVWWRADPKTGSALAVAMRARIAAGDADVSLVAPRFVTLTANRGRFPITISNGLPDTIKVSLVVTAPDSSGFRADTGDPVTIDPHRKATVTVSASAKHGGVVQVQAQLATAGGTEFGVPASFPVRTTDYGIVGWVVVGIGVGLLVLASAFQVGRRVLRYRRRTRPAAPTDGDGAPPGGGRQVEQGADAT